MRAGILVATWALLTLGCIAPHDGLGADDKDGPPAGEDMAVGGGDDGGGGLSCREIRPRVDAILRENSKCERDEDCVTVQTACGLTGACGDAYANKGWRTDEMERLLKDWATANCGMSPCPCPLRPILPPGCHEGVCGPKQPSNGGAIGAPCRAGTDCQSGECLTEGEDMTYVDGYCTMKGCGDRKPCPAGSSCRGTLGTTRICLDDCKTRDECRKGYNCCGGPGPVRAQWCVPEKNWLCLAR